MAKDIMRQYGEMEQQRQQMLQRFHRWSLVMIGVMLQEQQARLALPGAPLPEAAGTGDEGTAGQVEEGVAEWA